MTTTSKTRRVRKPPKLEVDEFGMSPANWVRLRAKTDADIIEDCRNDPEAMPRDRRSTSPTARRVARAKRIRWQLGMSQSQFSEAFSIPLGTLRDWEQHRAEPDRAALAYLEVIAAKPDIVRAYAVDAGA